MCIDPGFFVEAVGKVGINWGRASFSPSQATPRPGGTHAGDALPVPATQPTDCSCCLRQRIPASMKPSISPSKTESGLPTSWPVRRSLTIW